MPHETSLIAAISAGVGLAFIFGAIVARLKLPPLLGYLLAGLAVGPFTPGFVADSKVAHQLSELGVTLLMFGVGLHFSIRDLAQVRKIALPGAIGQIAVATLLGLGASTLMGFKLGEGVVFGLCLSVASTVVLLRALESRGEIDTSSGRTAVGWLVVEDIVAIVAIVMLPVLAHVLGGSAPGDPEGGLAIALVEILLKVAGFIGLMLIVGKRLLPLMLGSVFRNGPRELFTVGVVAVALGLAFGSAALFNISPALGAFLAGVVLSESDLSHQTSSEIKSLSTVFAVLFFVSIGMLFDPSVLIQYPLEVLAGLSIVLFGKSLASTAIMLCFKQPLSAALLVSASLAQIGELSFILGGIGLSLGILSQSLMSVIVAVGVISIALNPLAFSVVDRLVGLGWGVRKPDAHTDSSSHLAQDERGERMHLDDHVILVGYGRVGRIIARCLDEVKTPFLVIEYDHAISEQLQTLKIPAVFGDATRASDLIRANIETAKLLVVATPANSLAREIVAAARTIRADIPICVRTHTFADYCYFEEQQIQRTVLGELETALEMASFAFDTIGVNDELAGATIEGVRAMPREASK